ncbi:hypothetical protein AE372_004168 [Salmonella enterica subsp. enterica serovar Colindale]|nr:hypothetical protein [Salmonella enterica subsp. enterica serovar Colindale]
MAPDVEEGSSPEGRECDYVNMELLFTPEDKVLVGWPCDDDPQMATMWVLLPETVPVAT